MTGNMEQKGALIKNLEDAGCNTKIMSQFFSLEESGKTVAQHP